MALTKQTIERLRMVKRAILAEPKRYDQDQFGTGELVECQTACCIAGFASAMSGEYSKQIGVQKTAQNWLGLSNEQADDLFWDNWPDVGTSPAWQHPRTKEAADDGASHIERFIRNGGTWGEK